MQVQTPQSFRVLYDIQKNKYYRVNKITGETEASYKTGKIPAKFNPLVTGIDYVIRKKLNNFNRIDSSTPQSMKLSAKLNQKSQTQASERLSDEPNTLFVSTQPLNSTIRIDAQRQSRLNNMQAKNISDKNVRNSSLNKTKQQIGSSEGNLDRTGFPKLRKKPNSVNLLEARNLQNLNSFSSVFKTTKNQSISNQEYSLQKDHKNNDSLLNSMRKLGMMSNSSPTRMEFEKFNNKLKKYSQISAIKLERNNIQPDDNDQKSHRNDKFIEKSLLTSYVNQGDFQFQHCEITTPHAHFGMNGRKIISKTEINNQLRNQSLQRSSIMELAKKSNYKNSRFSQRAKSSITNQTSIEFKASDLQNLQNLQKIKVQLQKERSAFLSFYPKYVFKQNLRLIQEQKDRRINLKKLQQLSLQNNLMKFNKIYRSPNKGSDEKNQ